MKIKIIALRDQQLKNHTYNSEYIIFPGGMKCGDRFINRFHIPEHNKLSKTEREIRAMQWENDFKGFLVSSIDDVKIHHEDEKDFLKRKFPEFYYLATKLGADVKDVTVKGVCKTHNWLLFRLFRYNSKDYLKDILKKSYEIAKTGVPVIKAIIMGTYYVHFNNVYATHFRRYGSNYQNIYASMFSGRNIIADSTPYNFYYNFTGEQMIKQGAFNSNDLPKHIKVIPSVLIIPQTVDSLINHSLPNTTFTCDSFMRYDFNGEFINYDYTHVIRGRSIVGMAKTCKKSNVINGEDFVSQMLYFKKALLKEKFSDIASVMKSQHYNKKNFKNIDFKEIV